MLRLYDRAQMRMSLSTRVRRRMLVLLGLLAAAAMHTAILFLPPRLPAAFGFRVPTRAGDEDRSHKPGVVVLNSSWGVVPLRMHLRRNAPSPCANELAASELRKVPPIRFLIIGERKCGTSSLFRYLLEHPMVAPPCYKEPQYFGRRIRDITCAEYANQTFVSWGTLLDPTVSEVCYAWPELHPNGSIVDERVCKQLPRERALREAMVTGEGSVSYLQEADPAVVTASLPFAKLLLVLRDPASRVFSHFRMSQRFQTAQGSASAIASDEWLGETFETYVKTDLARIDKCTATRHAELACTCFERGSLVAISAYVCSLIGWVPYTKRSALLVLTDHELRADPNTTIARAAKHLGLPAWNPSSSPVLRHRFNVARSIIYNVAALQRALALLRRFYSRWNRLLSALLGTQLFSSGD